MESHRPPACRARGAVSASISTTPGICRVPQPMASHLWRAAASWLARRWHRRRRRASKANQSMEPAAAMTAGCCSACTTLLLPAASPARVPSVSLHVSTLTPTRTHLALHLLPRTPQVALLGTPSPALLKAATWTQNSAPGCGRRDSRRRVAPSTVLLVGCCQPSPTDQTWQAPRGCVPLDD